MSGARNNPTVFFLTFLSIQTLGPITILVLMTCIIHAPKSLSAIMEHAQVPLWIVLAIQNLLGIKSNRTKSKLEKL